MIPLPAAVAGVNGQVACAREGDQAAGDERLAVRRRRAPGEAQVGAERGCMEAGAEELGRRAGGLVDVRLQPEQRVAVSLAGGVDRGEHAGVVRVGELVLDDQVEELHAVHTVADEPRDVGGGIEAATPARRAQHAGGRAQPDEVERDVAPRVGMRQHRVEDERLHAIGVRDRIPLGDERPVGDAVDRQLLHAERGAQVVEVLDRVARRVERAPLPEARRARLDGTPRRNRDVGSADLRLEPRALDRRAARPALVDHHEAVVVQHGRDPPGDPRDRGDAGLARAAGEEEENAARRLHVVRGGDVQAQPALGLAGAVERARSGSSR